MQTSISDFEDCLRANIVNIVSSRHGFRVYVVLFGLIFVLSMNIKLLQGRGGGGISAPCPGSFLVIIKAVEKLATIVEV